MIFSDDVLVRAASAVLALCGFLVARYIYIHKKPNKSPLVCPVKFDCQTVVHSDYSRLLNIPLEIWGMIYYALIFISYFLLIFMPSALPSVLILFLVLLSTGASIFSIYLIYVQIFILKKGCTWCFISAFISIAIFVLTIIAYDIIFIINNLTQQ